MSTAEISLRVAAVLCWFTALGFGLPNLPAIWSLLNGRGVPLLFGFPAYGGGTFERFGITTSIPLLGAFLLICALEGVAGWLLREGKQSGGILALALLPLGAVFWIGFSLPVAPPVAIVRSALILLSWTSLR
jgi:hypothetical protein